MKNKKTIMTFSAIFILIYHLWINISDSVIENYLRNLCIIGVDIFFFISSYSISKKDKINYKDFILNRFTNIYLKFIIFTIVYYKTNIIDILLTILGIKFLIKGGGSFLWFIPSIMIMYLLIPFYNKLFNKNKKLTVFCTIIFYLIILLSLNLLTDYNTLFIFINRIPIILLGFYFGKYNIIDKLNKNKIKYYLIELLLIVIGIFITYYNYFYKFNCKILYDYFYFLNIPIEIGIILLLDKINTNKLFNIVGNSTLEIYAIQMIYGFKIANIFYKVFNIPLISNFITFIIIIVISLLFSFIYNKYIKKIQKEI